MVSKMAYKQEDKKIWVCDYYMMKGHTENKCWICYPYLKLREFREPETNLSSKVTDDQ